MLTYAYYPSPAWNGLRMITSQSPTLQISRPNKEVKGEKVLAPWGLHWHLLPGQSLTELQTESVFNKQMPQVPSSIFKLFSLFSMSELEIEVQCAIKEFFVRILELRHTNLCYHWNPCALYASSSFSSGSQASSITTGSWEISGGRSSSWIVAGFSKSNDSGRCLWYIAATDSSRSKIVPAIPPKVSNNKHRPRPAPLCVQQHAAHPQCCRVTNATRPMKITELTQLSNIIVCTCNTYNASCWFMVRCVCSPRTFLCSQILQLTGCEGESKSTSSADCAMENVHFKMSIQEPKHSQVYKCHIFSSPSYCAKSRSTAPWSNRAACHRSMAVLQVMQRFVHTVFTRFPSDKTWWQHTETAFKK